MVFQEAALVSALEQLQSPHVVNLLPAALLVQTCSELARMMPLLGPALHFAAYDVNNKLKVVEDHLDAYARDGMAADSLRTLMLWEIEHDLAHSSYAAPSLTRSVQRLLWMLDFVHALLHRLAQNPTESVQTLATDVYNAQLRAHHRWLVQKAVLLALHACPSRATMDAELPPRLQHRLSALLARPVAALKAFFIEQQLGDVQ